MMRGVKTPRTTTRIEFKLPLTREEAERIFAMGQEATIFVMLELARLARQNAPGPSTPSGMVPVYAKPSTSKRSKTPGAKPGHPGTRRAQPVEITRRDEHPPMEKCPDCGSPLGAPTERRFRLIEEVAETRPEVTEHSVPRQWCPTCRKLVEPPVEDALPKARFGHRIVTLSAWLHYGLGVTISQVAEVLGRCLQFEITPGGLVDAWQRTAGVFEPWHDQIADAVRRGGTLHADETGWRVNGKTHWLWCFTTPGATYYMIDRSRGSPALSKFFTETFDGVLVTDFWAAYGAVECAARQACLPHLFRELETVDEEDDTPAWGEFRKKLQRLLRDAVRLGAERAELPAESFASRRALLDLRRDELLAAPWDNDNARRLIKRLRRYSEALFTFLDHAEVPSDNNRAEREIRPAVIIRKNSLGNRSADGAQVQAVLMSIYRTLKLRGREPLKTLVDALKHHVLTGSLPPLPDTAASDG
jgi:transposase